MSNVSKIVDLILQFREKKKKKVEAQLKKNLLAYEKTPRSSNMKNFKTSRKGVN